jgi:hypothetical protein
MHETRWESAEFAAAPARQRSMERLAPWNGSAALHGLSAKINAARLGLRWEASDLFEQNRG